MTVLTIDVRQWMSRIRAVHVIASAVVAVVGAWAALGMPVTATRGYVATEVESVRLDALEARADIADLRLFLIDWTLRQAPLDPQPRAMIEAERLRVMAGRADVETRLQKVRALRP